MSAIFEQRACEVLDGHLPLVNSTPLIRSFAQRERRAKPRINDVLPARFWGVDEDGEVLSLDCQVDNLSSSGVFLRIPKRLRLSSKINLAVRLVNGSGSTAAITGVVMRDEPRLGGSRGVAVRITEHRFL